jgi:epoxyqueuosine reductase
MENHADLRLDPRRLMPGAKSVISLAYNYYRPRQEMARSGYIISQYAYGRDYHRVLRKKLKELISEIRQEIVNVNARICVDSAPIMEKPWAVRAGLGWIGKNTTLLIPDAGSYYFLSALVTDIELEYDHPMGNHCGACRECIDACPTGAIVEPYIVDSRKCISYLTIELQSEKPETMRGTYRGWIFGCDICQEVCPFNQYARPHREPDFDPRPELFAMTDDDWHNLTPDKFHELFAGTAIMRAKYAGLKRNIEFLRGA